MKLEELIEKHRPAPEYEDKPASGEQLEHLNRYRLLVRATWEQMAKDINRGRGVSIENVVRTFCQEFPTDGGDKPAVVITRRTAWEVLSEAQRNGLRIVPLQKPRRRPDEHDDEHGAFLPQ